MYINYPRKQNVKSNGGRELVVNVPFSNNDAANTLAAGS
jgi:hypothetical protein